MTDAANMVLLGVAGSSAVASAAFLARSLLWDPIKELRAAGVRQGKRIGRMGDRVLALELRLGIKRDVTSPTGVPAGDDDYSGRVRK